MKIKLQFHKWFSILLYLLWIRNIISSYFPNYTVAEQQEQTFYEELLKKKTLIYDILESNGMENSSEFNR